MRLDETQHKFGRCVVRVWRVGGTYYSAFPWRFSIQELGQLESIFIGIPNYCSTRHSALMRGWWRAKWINDGEWDKHYT